MKGHAWLGVGAVACGLALAPATVHASARASVYFTGTGSRDRLEHEADRRFRHRSDHAQVKIAIDPRRRFQRVSGLGAAFTDSSMWLLSRLPYRQRLRVLRQIFDPRGRIRLSVMRLPIGASDFAASDPYSYDDAAPGERDPTLGRFSIQHDRRYVIPLLRQVRQINPRVRLIASPWSPPAWMKAPESLSGWSSEAPVTLRADAYGQLAGYFVKFLHAYRAAGVPIWAVTPQNEPQDPARDYPGMKLSPAQEVQFVSSYLKPALRKAGDHTRLYGYDSVWFDLRYVNELLQGSRFRRAIDGLAFHCYFGAEQTMSDVHRRFPRLGLIESECSAPAMSAVDVALRTLTHHGSAAITWNLALDPAGGPKVGTGCLFCTALVTVDPERRTVRFEHDMWELAHVSRFVDRGAQRIGARAVGSSRLRFAAFLNPDGRVIFVATNLSDKPVSFSLRRSDSRKVLYRLPAASGAEPAVVTLVWTA
jgi:glucosylceramidase